MASLSGGWRHSVLFLRVGVVVCFGVGVVVRNSAAQCCVPKHGEQTEMPIPHWRPHHRLLYTTVYIFRDRIIITGKCEAHLMGASIALHCPNNMRCSRLDARPPPSIPPSRESGGAPAKLLRGIAIRSLLKWLSGCHGKTIYNDRQHIFGAIRSTSPRECWREMQLKKP